MSEANAVYSKLGANYTQKPNEFTFPSGARIVIGHLDDERAAEKYFGNVVHRAAVDELSFIADFDSYMKLQSCVRSNVEGIKAQMLLTGNPGGPGSSWILDRFIEPKDENGNVIPPRTTIREVDFNPFTGKDEEMTRVFIPSCIKDNIKGIKKDPKYYNRLLRLPELQRKAYLDGDWHAMGGTMFPEFRSKHREGEPPEACHVIPTGSRPLMPWLPRFAACDWGFAHSAVVYGAVQDLNGQTIIHKELVLRQTGSVELGDAIARLFLDDLDGLDKARVSPLITLYLSQDAFDKRDVVKTQAEGIAEGIARVLGPNSVHMPDLFPILDIDSKRDMFSEVKLQRKAGITIARAQTARRAGTAHVREMLRWEQIAAVPLEQFSHETYYELLHTSATKAKVYQDAFKRREPEVLPKLLIEAHCKSLIASIPALVADKDDIEDVLKTSALCDDCWDAVRYLLFSQGVSENREPQQSFVARHLQRIREMEPTLDYNGLCQAASFAEDKYAEETRGLHRSFNIPLEGARGYRDYRKRNLN